MVDVGRRTKELAFRFCAAIAVNTHVHQKIRNADALLLSNMRCMRAIVAQVPCRACGTGRRRRRRCGEKGTRGGCDGSAAVGAIFVAVAAASPASTHSGGKCSGRRQHQRQAATAGPRSALTPLQASGNRKRQRQPRLQGEDRTHPRYPPDARHRQRRC